MSEITSVRALSSRVLAVAVVNLQVGDWAAYIDAVPGKTHDIERCEVARTGNKLPKDIARLLFPYEMEKYKWRE